MATDTTNISTETVAGNAVQEGDVEQGHLTQSNAPVPVQVPAGENVVRIQVTPGETIQLPFPTDGLVAKLSPDNANLAVKVGDITVILLGYSEANANGDVVILGSNGQPVDVATVIANTDPNLDITTAAGPGAGDQGTGADNNGGLFTPFDPAAGLGGLNAVGGLDPTALNYGLVQREFPELIENDEIDTTPTLLNIRQGAVINEDDLANLREEFSLREAPDKDPYYQSQISGELADLLGIPQTHTGGPEEDGNDPFDLDDHDLDNNPDNDNDPNTPPPGDDNGQGVDTDREPLTSTAVITVDFHQDVPGKLTLQNGGTIPLQTQLEAMNLTSHGHELEYKLLPAVADDPNTPNDESHGEILVAYYVAPEMQWVFIEDPENEQGGEWVQQEVDVATIVFTIGVREQQGDTNVSEFHLDFTIFAPVDNVDGPIDADGSILDSLDINVPFFLVDSDGSVTPAPVDAVTFHDIDDVPSFGSVDWEYIGNSGNSGDSGGTWEQVIHPADLSIVHDETKGVQLGGSDIPNDGDKGPSGQWEDDTGASVSSLLTHVGWQNYEPIGAAASHVEVSFGADGRALGNKEAGQTVFTGDGNANATAYQFYLGNADAPLTAGATNWTVMIDGVEVTVRAIQVDANTIIGIANKGDVDGDGVLDNQQNESIAVDEGETSDVPVFVLNIDPDNGDVTLVQLHQINHGNTSAADETSPSLVIYGDNPHVVAEDHFNSLANWTVLGNSGASIVGDIGTSDAQNDPSNQALLVAGGGEGGDDTHSAAELEDFFGLPAGALSKAANDGSPFNGTEFATNGSAIKETFDVEAGQVLTVSFNFLDSEDDGGSSGPNYQDFGFIVIGDQVIRLSNIGEADFASGANSDGFSWNEESGYLTFTFTFAESGPVQIGFGLMNESDMAVSPGMLIDHLAITDGASQVNVRGTDFDGDHVDGALTVQIQDDGPTVVVTPQDKIQTLAVDETRRDGDDGVPSATLNFAANFSNGTIDYGTDGAHQGANGPDGVVYSLLLNGDGVASGLYAIDATDTESVVDGIGQGAQILLYNIDGVIHGRTSADGDDYFTISVDNDGNVTLAQQQNLWHAEAGLGGIGSFLHDDVQILDLADGTLKLVQTVTDADGDHASGAIDLSNGTFRFEDDGPVASINEDLEVDSLTLDESPVPQDGDGVKSVTADFGDNFNNNAIDYGTDGPGNVAYTLDLSADGISSGLYALDPSDTESVNDGIGQGDPILLYNIDGVIHGRTSADGDDYFTISVDGDGKVTFAQAQNIWHGDTASSDDTQYLVTDEATDLKITQTITDADGDTSSASINLGDDIFSIEDDGPNAVVNAELALPTFVLDESPIPADGDGIGAFTADFAPNFNGGSLDYGTDGPGHVSYALSIAGNGVLTNLYALDPNAPDGKGAEIALNDIGGMILGQAGGTTYFSIVVDSTGKVTFSQWENIWHGDKTSGDDSESLYTDSAAALKIVQTLTDADGDTSSASIDIGHNVFKIEDDGPSIFDGGTTVYMDETPGLQNDEVSLASLPSGIATLFSGFGSAIGVGKNTGGLDYSFGTDGPGSVHITDASGNDLNDASSGLYRVSDGAEIKFFTDPSDPTTVLGKVGNDVVIAVHLDTASNTLWVAQYAPIQHPNDNDSNDFVTTGGRMHLTVIDADGDKVTDIPSLVVIIRDDGPTISDGGATITLDETPGNQGGTRDTSDVSATLSALAATFGIGSAIQTAHTIMNAVGFSYGADGAGSVMLGDANGAAFNGTPSGFTRTSDGAAILLYTDATNPTILKGMVGNELVLAIHLDTSNNSIWVATYQPVKHADTTDSNDTASGTIDNIHITVTDRDGDHVTSGASITVQILDDGPTVTLTTHGNISITLDESVGADASDPNTSPTADEPAESGFFGTKKGSAAGLFNPVNFGTDGAGAGINPEYKLVLRNTDGSGTSIGTTEVATNLVATDPAGLYANDNIILVSVSDYQVNGYVGHYDGVEATDILAFVVRIDKVTGEITVSQALPIAHDVDGSTAAAHDDTATLTAGSLGGIFVSLTATDGDGDKASVETASPLGISFEDDGPTLISASSNLAIDEDSLPNGIADGPGDDAGTASANFAVNVDFGQDGKAATAFELTGVTATANGLPLALATAGGQPIVISVLAVAENGYPAGTLVGWSGPALNDHSYWAFTVTIGQNGQGTFNLLLPLNHPSQDNPATPNTTETSWEDNIVLSVGVRATDGDGDTVTAAVTINVDDDTPQAVGDTFGSFVENSAEVDLGTVQSVLLANDKTGADGINAYSSNQITLANGGIGSLGGIFTVKNINGADHLFYKPAANVADDAQETIQYTVKDKDGDATTATITTTVTDRSGGTSAVDFLGDGEGAFEDNQSSSIGQSTADDANQHLTLTFNLKATATDPGDTVDQVTIGGIPTGATATWSDGVHTLTFSVGSNTITLLSGGTENVPGTRAAFLADLIDGNGANIQVTLAEHDSRDVVITMQSVIDGTATGSAQDTAIVDAVAAQPIFTVTPGAQTLVETGGAATNFTVSTSAFFHDLADTNETQYILVSNVGAGWGIDSVSINGVALTATLSGPQFGGYTTYEVTGQADALNGAVPVVIQVHGPGNVDTVSNQLVQIIAGAQDQIDGVDRETGNNYAQAYQSVTLTVTDRSGGTDDISFVGGGEGGYEDGQAAPAGQTAVDPTNGQLSLTFNLKATATDPGDTVGQVIVGGIPTGATATWTDGVHTLTFPAGTTTITPTTGGTGSNADRAAFLADLIDGNGANLVVTLQEHDSRDVTLTMQSTIGGTQTTGDTVLAIVDAVAAQPVLGDIPDQAKQETGAASTTFTVNTTATFADFGDGNEVQYVLIQGLDAGWSLGTMTIGGVPATAVPGGLAAYPGYIAFAVSAQADSSQGQVSVSFTVNGPGNVAADTTKSVVVWAVAIDTEEGAGLNPNNNVAEAAEIIELKVVDRVGGNSDVNYTGGGEGGYEDGQATPAGQTAADPVNGLLSLAFNLKATATDPGDTVNQTTIGGIPSGATATWTDGVHTLTFPAGTTTITPTSGGTGTDADRAAFLADLIDGNGANILVKVAEHDSRDFTLTMQSVIGGQSTNIDQAFAVVDAVAAQPALLNPTDDSKQESGAASTTFTVTTMATFADIDDANEAQFVLVKNPDAGWTLGTVTIDGVTATAVPGGLAGYPGYTAFAVSSQADANDGSKGSVSLAIEIIGPGDVAASTTKSIEIRAVAIDTEEGVGLGTGNDKAEAVQMVDLTITDRTGGTDSVTLKTDPALGYEDGNATSAGQTSADPLNTQLTLVFTMKVTPTDPTDPVDQAVIGGIPTGAVATWTDGVHTLTFAAGSNTITAVSGGTENVAGTRAAFLAALESAGGADISVKLAEHDSRDVTLTMNSTVGGTLSGGDHTETAIVDAVAAQPGITGTPGNQSKEESGGVTTSFTINTTLTFADVADANERQYLLVKIPSAGWEINTISLGDGGDFIAVWQTLPDYPGFIAFELGFNLTGTISVGIGVQGPANVHVPSLSETIEYQARSIDVVEGQDLTLANNTAFATQSVTLTVTDSAPSVSAVQTTIRVDEDGFAAGNQGVNDDLRGDDTSTDSTTFSGNFNYTAAKDAITGITLGTTGGLTGLVTLDNLPVKTVWDAGTKTLTGFADADNDGVMDNGERPVFTLVVTDVATGAYTFTLNEPIRHDAANGGAGANYEDDKSFQINIQVTDADGSVSNVAQATINIDDDTPVADSDIEGFVNSGATKTGTVLNGVGDDSFGADGAKVGGGVVGAVVGINNTPQTTGIATVLHGTYGDLTLQANGTYSYTAKPNAQIGAGGSDVFSYTIEDGDGDRTTAQVYFSVLPVTLTVTPGDATVDEAALDTVTDIGDLGHGTVTGSQPNLTTETVTGSLTLALGVSVTPQTNVVTPLGIFSIDASGHYTYTLTSNSLAHTSDLPNTDPNARNPDAVVDTFTINISDTNGNTGSTTVTIHVKDDVPSIETNGTDPSVTVDETALGVASTGYFATAFSNTNFGADGVGSLWNYTLAIKSVGAVSGLTDTATGLPIVLVMNNGVVEGHVNTTGGVLAFTASVNSINGDVTLTQYRAVLHADAANPDDARTLIADDLVTLTVTIVDKDGDSASASLNIGQNLVFKDDGPTLAATGTMPTLTVDETFLGTDDTKNFAGVFVPSYGADGAGQVNNFVLGVKSDGADSGLVDVASNQAIVLKLNGNVVEGHVGTTGGALAFTLSVNAAGDVKLDQILAMKHPNTSNPDDSVTLSANDLITLTATVTDKDGDTNTATANIGQALNFKDDGPTISVSAAADSLIVDESFLGIDATANFADNFTSSFGNDGQGTLAYALSVIGGPSGLIDTATNQIVNLSITAGGVVEGRTAGSNDLVFTVTVNSSGLVTLDQARAVVHANTSNPDDATTLSAANLVKLTATITDKDGDSQAATLNIGQALSFKDDGPTISVSAAADALTVDESFLGTDATANFADNFTTFFGADNAGTVTYALGTVVGFSGLFDTASGNPVMLSVTAGGVVEGRTQFAPNDLVFTVSVDANGVVTLDQIRAVTHLDTTNPDDSRTLSAANLVTLTATITDKDGDSQAATINIGQALTFKDDGPTANPDVNSVKEDTAPNPVTGNVLTNDAGGADGKDVVTQVAGVAGNVGTTIDTTYGTIVINANGSYTYTLDNTKAAVQQLDDGETLTDQVTYQMKDKDGDLSSTTLTITINGTNDAPVVGNATARVSEEGLTGGIADTTGNTDTTDVVTKSGTISITDKDIETPTVTLSTTATLFSGGVAITWSGDGTAANHLLGKAGGVTIIDIVIDSSGNYTVKLLGPVDHGNTAQEDEKSFDVTVTANDGTVSSTGTLTVIVEDDSPSAVADVNSVKEDTAPNPVTGNVLGNDLGGGDGVGVVTQVAGVAGNVGTTINTTYGTVVINANGSYTYTLDNTKPAVQGLDDGETLTDTVTYQMKDKDGDLSSTTLTITINGLNDAPQAVADTNWVKEDTNLTATGNVLTTNAHGGAPSGTFSDNADTDVDVETLTVTTTGTFNGTYGTLVLNANGTYTYTLYTQAQNAGAYNTVQALDTNDAPITETFNYTATDGTATASSSLTISIFGTNDAPQAVADTNWVKEDTNLAATGNVLTTNAHGGAPSGTFSDNADTDVDVETLTVTSTGTFNLAYGQLVINANGGYTYTLYTQAQNAGAYDTVQALDTNDAPITDTFNYTISDGTTTAGSTLTISIFGTNDAPVVGVATARVSEEGLTGGIADTTGNTDTTDVVTKSGTISITDKDIETPTVTLSTTATLFSGGVAITWSGDGTAANHLLGKAGGVTIIDIVIDSSGNYTVKLLGPVDHGNTAQEDEKSFDVTVTANDGTVSSTGTLTVIVEDDSPSAVADVNSVKEDTAPNPVTGNVLGNDLGGGDGVGVVTQVAGVAGNVGTTINTTYGTVVINANGSYTYTLDNSKPAVQALNNGQTLTDQVTYQMKDKDGDLSSTTLTITINGTSDGPLFNNATALVDEDGLPGGSLNDVTSPTNDPTPGDDVGGKNSTSEAVYNDTLSGLNWQGNVGALTLSVNQTQLNTITLLDGTHPQVGQVSGNNSSHLVINNGTGQPVLDIVINPTTGAYTVTLLAPVKHNSIGVEDNVTLDVTITGTSSAGTNTATLTINIDDDLPTANPVGEVASGAAVLNTNLMLVLDISGSMGWDSDLTGNNGSGALSKMLAARAAVNELLEQYNSLGDVMVRIVTFSGGSAEQTAVWMTLTQAKTFVNALVDDGGSTNYDAALIAAMGAFGDAGRFGDGTNGTVVPGNGAPIQNVSYFISDGQPNQQTNFPGVDYSSTPNGSGIQAPEETAWINFLKQYDIKSYAIGVDPSFASQQSWKDALKPIAYDGAAETNDDASLVITLSDFGALAQSLIGTIPTINASLLLNSNAFGGDGGFVKSLSFANGTVLTYNPATNTIGSSGVGVTKSYDPATHLLTVTLAEGVLVMNMATSVYVFTPDSGIGSSVNVPVGFVLADNDGESASSTLTLGVVPVDYAPIARDDSMTVADSYGSGFAIDNRWLLWNDSDADGDTITVASPLTVNTNSAGTATYTANAGGQSDTGDVTYGETSGTTLNGNGLDNIIVGDGDNETLNGYEGKDVLVGGGGNDNLTGGEGDDLLMGGTGNDTYNFVGGFTGPNATGKDLIVEEGGSADTVVLTGTTLAQVTLTQVGNNLKITYGSNADTVTVEDQFSNPNKTVEFITIAGTTYQISGTTLVALVPPSTNDTSASGNEDASSIAVNLSGTDNGSVASFKITSIPGNGTLYKDAALTQVIAANDVVTATGNAATVYFKPNANYNGVPTFQYASVDNLGMQDASPATATITVNAVNDAPTATITSLTYSATEQTNLTIHGTGLSVADAADGNSGSMTVTLSVAYGILNATAGNSGASVSGSGTASLTITGTVTQINNLLGGVDTGGGSAGTITYNANTDAPPASTTLSLQINDGGNVGGGALTGSDTATINITATNDAPSIVQDYIITNETGVVTVQDAWLLRNDTDPEGNVLTITAATTSDAGNFDTNPSHAGSAITFLLDTAGGGGDHITNGEQTSLTYTLSDGSSTDNTPDTTITYVTGTTLTGTANDEIIIGSTGNETITGGAGNDILVGNGGNDTLTYDANDTFIGGTGVDRVLVGDSGAVSLTYSSTKYSGVEIIDLGDTSNRNNNEHTVVINAADVIDAGAGGTTVGGHVVDLVVMGDTSGSGTGSDNVDLNGFTALTGAGNVNVGYIDPFTSISHNYNIYVSSTDPNVKVAVEVGLDVI